MGLLFAIVGVVIMVGVLRFTLYMMGSGTAITCQRVESKQVDCTIERSHWLGFTRETIHQLKQVQHAQSRSYTCRDGKKRTKTCYELVIQTQDGKVQSTGLSVELADEINHFLDSKQLTWGYKKGTSKLMAEAIIWVIIALIGVSVGAMFTSIGLVSMFGKAKKGKLRKYKK